jgi:hypothetical protein
VLDPSGTVIPKIATRLRHDSRYRKQTANAGVCHCLMLEDTTIAARIGAHERPLFF